MRTQQTINGKTELTVWKSTSYCKHYKINIKKKTLHSYPQDMFHTVLKTAFISLTSINRWAFVLQTKCSYCAELCL